MFANQVAVAVGFGGEPETTLGALEEKKRCFLYVEDSTILHFTHLSTDASDLTQNGTQEKTSLHGTALHVFGVVSGFNILKKMDPNQDERHGQLGKIILPFFMFNFVKDKLSSCN